MKFKGLSWMKVKKRCNSCSAGDQRFISGLQPRRDAGDATGTRRRGDADTTPGRGTRDARDATHAYRGRPRWIIASFIKFSGTKLREFLIENKLRRDSLIWISILRIKCGFMFSFRCFFPFVMQNNVPPCLGTTTRFIFEWKTLLKLSFPV